MRSTNWQQNMQYSILYFLGFHSMHSKLAGKLGDVRYAAIDSISQMKAIILLPRECKAGLSDVMLVTSL